METTGTNSRSVHLVGSVPLADAAEVFKAVARALGGRLNRMPDGETGPERSRWAACQIPYIKSNPQLETVVPERKNANAPVQPAGSPGGGGSQPRAFLPGGSPSGPPAFGDRAGAGGFGGERGLPWLRDTPKVRLREGVSPDDLRFDNLGYGDWAL
jgi:hypothetical protein